MTMQRIGGFAGLTCAATYIFGFILLLNFPSELGYGTNGIDVDAVVQYTIDNQAIMITWNTVIYIINALALTLLVVSLGSRLKAQSSDWSSTAMAFGMIWATLVLGAGMIANVETERAVALASSDF